MVVSQAKCTKCNKCIEGCPVQAITMTDAGAHIDKGICIDCGYCMMVCPSNAISEG